jgi:HK97 family phage major capsid protein
MSTSTHAHAVAADRLRAAQARLNRAAAEVRTNAGDAQAQLRYEQSAADVLHHRGVLDALGSPVDATPYADGKASYVADFIRAADGTALAERRRLAADREMRGLSMADNGALVVPQYLVDRVRSSGHSLRPLCDLAAMPLPPVGGTVTLMRASTGTTAAAQATEGSTIIASDPVITDTTLPVRTVWSAMDITLQALTNADQVGLDLLVARELVGGVDAKQEQLVLNGAGTSGEPTGLLNISGIGSVSLTSTTTTSLLDAVGKAAQQSHVATGGAADTVVMHPRRWAWLLANAGDQAAAMQVATTAGPVAGRLLGLDVVTSAAVPSTLSTDQDAVVVMQRNDLYVGEAPTAIDTQVDAASLANNVAARIVVSRYYATGVDRPAGVVKITGTGLANPYA